MAENDEDPKQLIYDIYELLADQKVIDSIKKNTEKIKNLNKDIINGKYKLYFTVLPFTDVSFQDIKIAADILDIELDEHVYIPELETWTKKKIPVGVTYVQALEQTAEIYSNIRSAGKYQSLTGQPTKGKAREGGQAISQLDINCLTTYNAEALLSELLTVRSDDVKSKRAVYNQIISTGKCNLPRLVGKGGTSNLLRVLIQSLNLTITKPILEEDEVSMM